AVDRQGEVVAGLRRAHQVHVLDDAAAAVADHLLGAGFAAQPVVERELDAFLAAVVDVGEAEYVRQRLALRVEAPELALREYAGDVEREDRARLVWVHAPAQVHELLVAALPQLAGQLVGGHAERGGEFGQPVRVLEQLLRVAPDRFDRRRHRQRLAVAVGDHAARGRDRDLAQEAGIALLAVEVVVDQLQVDRAADQRERAQPERAADQRQPPAQVEAAARARLARLARRLAGAALPAAAGTHAHGRTTTMSRVSGKRMPRRLRATWSMRLLSAQVACSSCRRPNSMLRSSRA